MYYAFANKINSLLWFLKKYETIKPAPKCNKKTTKQTIYKLYFFCSWLPHCLLGGFDSFVLDFVSR